MNILDVVRRLKKNQSGIKKTKIKPWIKKNKWYISLVFGIIISISIFIAIKLGVEFNWKTIIAETAPIAFISVIAGILKKRKNNIKL